MEAPRADAVAAIVLGGHRVPEVLLLVLGYAPLEAAPVAVPALRGLLYLVQGRPDVFIRRAPGEASISVCPIDMPNLVLATGPEPDRSGRDDDDGHDIPEGAPDAKRALWSGNDAGHFAPHREPNLLMMRDGTRLTFRIREDSLVIAIYRSPREGHLDERHCVECRFPVTALENLRPSWISSYLPLAVAWDPQPVADVDGCCFLVCRSGEFRASWDVPDLQSACGTRNPPFHLRWASNASSDEVGYVVRGVAPIPGTCHYRVQLDDRGLAVHHDAGTRFVLDANNRSAFALDADNGRILVLSRTAKSISAIRLPGWVLPARFRTAPPCAPACAPACACCAPPGPRNAAS